MDVSTVLISIASSLGLSAVIIPWTIQYLSKKYVEEAFSKRVENHRHQLQMITENSKFDYQRKIQDFNLYTSKKHDHYIKLYEAILHAQGYVYNLVAEIKQVYGFGDFNEDDLKNYLKDIASNGKIDEIIKMWNIDRKAAEREIRIYEKLTEERLAKQSVNDLQNTYLDSRLYLSSSVQDVTSPIIEKLRLLSLIGRSDYMHGASEDIGKLIEEKRQLQKEIDFFIEQAIERMKREMAVGYYQE